MFKRIIIGLEFMLVFLSSCSPTPADLEGVNVQKLESDWHFSYLAWSPNGRFIAAAVADVNSLERSIQIIDLQEISTHSVEYLEERILYEALGSN